MVPQKDTTATEVLAIRGEAREQRADVLASEEPMEIRVTGPAEPETRVAVTMRTPGHDAALAVGFLFTEGLIEGPNDLAGPVTSSGARGNVVSVPLRNAFDSALFQRNFYTTSSCGVCGKAALEHIEREAPPLPKGPLIARSALLRLSSALREEQQNFERTGGLHAAGLFDETGHLKRIFEDVGRHNALDKAVGDLVLSGLSASDCPVLLASGRVSFELVQKAAMAAIPVFCAVSAPSSLAVETARRLGMTLVGFLRGDSFNVYAGAERLDLMR